MTHITNLSCPSARDELHSRPVPVVVVDDHAIRCELLKAADGRSRQHLAFSPEFTAAVEAKQVAQQDAQRAAFVVDKARQEKQAMVVKAQGEAESAKLIGEAIKKNKAYVDLKKIENARLIAQQLQEAGAKNRLMLDSEGLGLNVFASPEQK